MISDQSADGYWFVRTTREREAIRRFNLAFTAFVCASAEGLIQGFSNSFLAAIRLRHAKHELDAAVLEAYGYYGREGQIPELENPPK